MNVPFFSIIVPVYNVEKYIVQCIDSVLCQTYNNYELILVDDGSKDKSFFICEEYRRKDNRIKVIHKKNGGLSSARNCGIKNSCGKYILFLDSDDYWENKYNLEKLNSAIIEFNNVDIVVFSAKLLYPNGKILDDQYNWNNQYFEDGLETLKELISKNMIIGSACTKAIKRDYLIKNDLYFKEGIKSEDIEWIFRLSMTLPNYYYLNNKFYIYRQMREGSISNTIDSNHIEQYFNIISNYYDDSGIDENIKEVFNNYVSYQFSLLCAFVENCKDQKLKKNMKIRIRKYSGLLKYNLMTKMKKVSILYGIFGFNITIIVLGLYLKVKQFNYI